MILDNNYRAFVALINAGLWEKDVQLLPFGNIEVIKLHRLATEQSVLGLLAAGIEHIVDVKIPQGEALFIVGDTLQLEQRNRSMNLFLGPLTEKLKREGINTILVKGQGVAQCYERPLWRTCGDIDLLVSDENYERVKNYLIGISQDTEQELKARKHLGLFIDGWDVEIHGSLRGNVLDRMNKGIDEVQREVFDNGKVSTWRNREVNVSVPAPDENVIIIFSHILQHFFENGVGLRQVCDWCRFLWVNQGVIDRELLGKRLRSMGIMTEWKAFAAMAVEYLDMPEDAMPLYAPSKMWSRKAERIMAFIMEKGNFGHNHNETSNDNVPYIIRKAKTLWRYTWDSIRYYFIFPQDSFRVWFGLTVKAVVSVVK